MATRCSVDFVPGAAYHFPTFAKISRYKHFLLCARFSCRTWHRIWSSSRCWSLWSLRPCRACCCAAVLLWEGQVLGAFMEMVLWEVLFPCIFFQGLFDSIVSFLAAKALFFIWNRYYRSSFQGEKLLSLIHPCLCSCPLTMMELQPEAKTHHWPVLLWVGLPWVVLLLWALAELCNRSLGPASWSAFPSPLQRKAHTR